MQSVEVKYY